MLDAAEDVLSWFAGRYADGTVASSVYRIMGVDRERVTLASQQGRAHNLAWALDREGRIEGSSIAVVGGGLAGVTFAVVAARLGGQVTLYEQAGRLLPTQWKSYDRYLHPTLFHWPEDRRSPATRTPHPALPWSADFAAAVREEILRHLRLGQGGLDINLNAFVTSVTEDAGVRVAAWTVGDSELRATVEHFDCAIVATGFPAERPVGGSFGGSYWRTQCDGSQIPRDWGVRIVGNGDGALTELMTLSLPGFRQDRLRNFVNALDRSSAGDAVSQRPAVAVSVHEHLSAILARAPSLCGELGRAVDDLAITLTSKHEKLNDRSFLINRCAAVSIDLARSGEPSVFEDPRSANYDDAEIEQDREARRHVVMRLGPGRFSYLLRSFAPACGPVTLGTRVDSWERRWTGEFARRVRTKAAKLAPESNGGTSAEARPLDLSTLPIPWQRLLPAAAADASDVPGALDALVAFAAGLVPPELLDRSAVLVGDEHGRPPLVAIDAVAAVASLPTAVVLDELLLSEQVPLLQLGGRLFVEAAPGQATTDGESAFRRLAVHIAVDAQAAHRWIGAQRQRGVTSRIPAFLHEPDLIEMLGVAIRANRTDVHAPAAVLRSLAARSELPEGLEDDWSRLLRLVAIAVTPDSGRAQGRMGLLRIGRAVAKSTWIAEDMASFIGVSAVGLGRKLVLSAILPIAPSLDEDGVLPMTATFMSEWASLVAPADGSSNGLDIDQGYAAFAHDVRELADVESAKRRSEKRSESTRAERGVLGEDAAPHRASRPLTDMRVAVEAMIGAHGIARRLVRDAEPDDLLRRFGLVAAPSAS